MKKWIPIFGYTHLTDEEAASNSLNVFFILYHAFINVGVFLGVLYGVYHLLTVI